MKKQTEEIKQMLEDFSRNEDKKRAILKAEIVSEIKGELMFSSLMKGKVEEEKSVPTDDKSFEIGAGFFIKQGENREAKQRQIFEEAIPVIRPFMEKYRIYSLKAKLRKVF